MAVLTTSRRVFRQEVELHTGQFLTRKPVACLPDELQLADGGRRPATDTSDEELSQRQRLPRAVVHRRRGGAVGERAVERVRAVMTAGRTRELTHIHTTGSKGH